VNTLYLDIFSGLSGDMFIGAMLDLGLKLDYLERELAKLHLEGYHLRASRAKRSEIEGTRFEVHLGHHLHEDGHGGAHAHSREHTDEHGRTYADIRQLIASSGLSDWVKARQRRHFTVSRWRRAKFTGALPTRFIFTRSEPSIP